MHLNNNALATKKGNTLKRYAYTHIVQSVSMNEPVQKIMYCIVRTCIKYWIFMKQILYIVAWLKLSLHSA